VLVLEFVPGLTVNNVDKSTSKADIHDFVRLHLRCLYLDLTLLNKCALGVNAVRNFAHSGWSLGDIRGPNFILTGAPGAWTVVIIDLFLVQPCGSLDLERVAEIEARRCFFNFAICVRDVYPGIYKWARKDLRFPGAK
jgi:hypothetical protein